uniref:Primase/polymerase n=1 Tax=Thermococcus sp. CIR10 TaxID=1197731 RepID=L0B8H7_9EURY|nr:hypothetical protein [Thermococcus sp. CIR10]AFZ84272.1 Primase/polymerase [Thermococcus sp. CIR10]
MSGREFKRPSDVIIDIYKVIQDHPEAGRLAIEFRFYPYPTSEWILLNDIEDKAREIDKVLFKNNILGKKEAYISMAIHDFDEVTKKLEKLQELEHEKAQKEGRQPKEITLRHVQGEATGKIHTTVSSYTLTLVVDIDVNEIHDSKAVESEEKALEVSKRAWEVLKPNLEELGIKPRYVFFTGGGIQLWFVAPEPENISVIDKAAEIIPPVLNTLLPEGYSVDNIFDRARIVRVPFTVNYKYKTPDGKPLELRGRLLEFNDVRTPLGDILEKLEAYAKGHKISLGSTSRSGKFRGVAGRYEVKKENFEELAKRLVEELAPWFKKIKERGGSRHHLVNAIAAYIARNTNLTEEDLLGKDQEDGTHVVGLWELVHSKLVELGLEDPGDWSNRYHTIKDVYEKLYAGTTLGTRAYMMKYLNVSEEEAIEILRSVKRALFPYLHPVNVQVISKFEAKPYSKEEAPTEWEAVDEDRKKAVGIWYIEVLALETANYVYIEDLSKPGVFYIVEKVKRTVKVGKKEKGVEVDEYHFNPALWQSFLNWLGIKEGEPIEREELWNLLLEKFDIKDYELRAIYFRKILHLLSPEGMRRPRCVEEFLRELADEGFLSEDKVRHLAHWIKFYAKPLRHSTTSIMLRAKGKPVDMRMAVWAKVVEFFAEDEETAQGLIETFREAYEQAEPPFPCFGARECPFFQEHRGCPFIAPKRDEILAVSLVDVQLHGSDGIVIIVGSEEGTKKFVHKGKVEWQKQGKSKIKYPVAEWFLDVYAKEFLSLPEAPSWSHEEVTEILKSRARVVRSQLNEFDEYFDNFIDWLRSENARGIYPYEKADSSHIFIKGNMIGIPPRLAEDFYRNELGISGRKFKEMLIRELGSYYLGKKAAWIKLSSGQHNGVNCYFISLDWFKKIVGEPNIKDIEAEGDIGSGGFNYEEEEGEA